MKFPQILTAFIVAIVFAVVGYFLASPSLDGNMVALLAFCAAFISPFISHFVSGGQEAEKDIKTLYVGNLPYRANEAAVRTLFSEYGQVHSVRLMKDKHTGKRRGFGFVEMAANDSDNAVAELNDTEFQQRTLKVREAKERPEKGAERD